MANFEKEHKTMVDPDDWVCIVGSQEK